MLAGAEDHLATFPFSGVSQTIVKHSTWGQCPQVLAGTARKVAKSTRLCSYTPWPSNPRNTPSTAGNSMTGSERPSPEPLLKKKKRGVPSRTGGERILETLRKPQMPWIIGLGASQPYSRGKFQETLWERFRGLSKIFPEFLPESPSRTGGMASNPLLFSISLLVSFSEFPCLFYEFFLPFAQRKTKGQQLKGKIVSEFFALFHNFSHIFIILSPGLSPSKQRIFSSRRTKEKKR